jgi:outer membrane protein assembly factor BamB
VFALDAQTGTELWHVKPAGPLRGSPTVAFNAVYVMTTDNQIHALSMADGTPIWDKAAATGPSGVFGVAAPGRGQGTVIAGYSSGELVAYRYENGRDLWSDALARTSISTQVGTLTDVDADPIIDNGRVYALGQGGRMAAYELVTGQRLWELSLAGISTPGGGRRMGLHADRRCAPAGDRPHHRSGTLGHPARALAQSEKADRPDLLDRPGAGQQPAVDSPAPRDRAVGPT